MALRARQFRGRPCTITHLTRPRGRLVQEWPDVRNAFDGWSKAARVELANKVSRHVDSVVPRWGMPSTYYAELVARNDRARRQCAAGDHPKTLAIDLGYTDRKHRGCIPPLKDGEWWYILVVVRCVSQRLVYGAAATHRPLLGNPRRPFEPPPSSRTSSHCFTFCVRSLLAPSPFIPQRSYHQFIPWLYHQFHRTTLAISTK